MMAMVCVEMSPATTVTVEFPVIAMQGPCAFAGIVLQPAMKDPVGTISWMTTCPAGTRIAGEHAPAGTTILPGVPFWTVKVTLPVTFPCLQISR
jgi:hypothetical protein